jgi:hypothetical protein
MAVCKEADLLANQLTELWRGMGSHRAVFSIPSIRLGLWDPSLNLVPTFKVAKCYMKKGLSARCVNTAWAPSTTPESLGLEADQHVKKRDLGEDFWMTCERRLDLFSRRGYEAF